MPSRVAPGSCGCAPPHHRFTYRWVRRRSCCASHAHVLRCHTRDRPDGRTIAAPTDNEPGPLGVFQRPLTRSRGSVACCVGCEYRPVPAVTVRTDRAAPHPTRRGRQDQRPPAGDVGSCQRQLTPRRLAHCPPPIPPSPWPAGEPPRRPGPTVDRFASASNPRYPAAAAPIPRSRIPPQPRRPARPPDLAARQKRPQPQPRSARPVLPDQHPASSAVPAPTSAPQQHYSSSARPDSTHLLHLGNEPITRGTIHS